MTTPPPPPRPRRGRPPARQSDLRDLREAHRWTLDDAVAWTVTIGLPHSRGAWRKWEAGDHPVPPLILRLLRGEVELVARP